MIPPLCFLFLISFFHIEKELVVDLEMGGDCIWGSVDQYIHNCLWKIMRRGFSDVGMPHSTQLSET